MKKIKKDRSGEKRHRSRERVVRERKRWEGREDTKLRGERKYRMGKIGDGGGTKEKYN